MTSRAETVPALTSRAICAPLRSIDVGHILLGDDAGNAKETALALRGLRQDDLAIEARPHAYPRRPTLRDSTTCAVAGTAFVSSSASAFDVLEQVAELRAEAIDLFVGQCDSREFGDVAYVNLIG